MRITITTTATVQEILDEILEAYGSEEALRARLKKNKRDPDAIIALHNLREYREASPDKRITETREVVIPDSQLGLLTASRLQLLLSLKQAHGEVQGVRRLAELVKRDVKNVSEDVQILSSLGLVLVESKGRGKPNTIRLPGHSISLHLVDHEPTPA